MYTFRGIHKPKGEQPFKNCFLNVLSVLISMQYTLIIRTFRYLI